MSKIKIFDTTLRDGEQTPGVNLNLSEKMEIAKQLEKIGVNYIEGGFAIASDGDFSAISALAGEIKNCGIVSLARAVEKDIDRAWEAVKLAAQPRIHTFLATSPIHMKYKLRMNEEEVLERAINAVKHAKKYTNDVEFSAEDASRSDLEFLCKVIEGVIAAGAVCVNIPDTVGYSYPIDFGQKIKYIKENVRGIENVDISVHCHNDLGLAVANSLAAIENGATQVECTINGLGERAGNASLEEVIMNLTMHPQYYNVEHSIDTTGIYRTSKLVSSLTGVIVQPNKAIVGANAFAHESGIHQHGVLAERSTYEIMTPQSVGVPKNKMVLGKLSGRHAFKDHIEEMGYKLSEEEIDAAFVKMKEIADKKQSITDEDIEAIVELKVHDVPETYSLVSFQVSTGNKMISTGTIELEIEGKIKHEAATGDGPIDALFHAINRLTKTKLKLDEYSLRAVTGGADALGEVRVVIEHEDKKYRGKGVSTDIIEASIKGYLNAINKMLLDQ